MIERTTVEEIQRLAITYVAFALVAICFLLATAFRSGGFEADIIDMHGLYGPHAPYEPPEAKPPAAQPEIAAFSVENVPGR
jgi:hypothetical protein